MPSAAVMTLAVVQAIPFVVNVRLYGAQRPVSRSHRSFRMRSPRSDPVIDSPPYTNSSSLCSVAKWTSSNVSSSWFCRAWTSDAASTP
ncbi:Uncharacterised protein [Rhodococcus wratislaviensis]|uniref:Secreted protein n=1 Tax=Rhodococcus wratislaviensis TaxID=44752 RepID=A0AB38FMD1_RHOWR|nr:Uncharacterised protein [Rhodococcus wratislaviensis]